MSAPAVEAPVGFVHSVSDIAAASGAAPSAVRFYEKHGLITAQRTSGDQRRFSDDAVCRIRVARVAQRVGLTVREIADIFAELPEDAQPHHWERVADVLIAEAEARVAALRDHLDSLGSGTKLCDL
jgi:MerR family redox-sensitive transcriptional activator SoxR